MRIKNSESDFSQIFWRWDTGDGKHDEAHRSRWLQRMHELACESCWLMTAIETNSMFFQLNLSSFIVFQRPRPSSDHHEPNSVALSGLNTHISMKLFVSSCIVNGLLRKVSCNFGKEKEHLMLEKYIFIIRCSRQNKFQTLPDPRK